MVCILFCLTGYFQNCNRVLESVDFDDSVASFVQFQIKLDCSTLDHNPNHAVVLDISNDGGISWKQLYESER